MIFTTAPATSSLAGRNLREQRFPYLDIYLALLSDTCRVPCVKTRKYRIIIIELINILQVSMSDRDPQELWNATSRNRRRFPTSESRHYCRRGRPTDLHDVWTRRVFCTLRFCTVSVRLLFRYNSVESTITSWRYHTRRRRRSEGVCLAKRLKFYSSRPLMKSCVT